MFDNGCDVDELDRVAAGDALVENRRALWAAEARQYVLAAHWADLHAPEFVESTVALLPGEEGTVRAGADGTPEMEEYAAAELAAFLLMSTRGGEQVVADAVNLRHRHPVTWARLQAGEVRAWVAVKAARRCADAGLSREQAVWVDAETASYLPTLPTGRWLALVEAKIVEVDPAAAEERAEAAALARFVHAGRADEHGMATLVARARAGDVRYLVAVLDRMAAILAARGDTDTLDVRRATALRILANPARALALLTEATLEPPAQAPSPRTRRGEKDMWMRDAAGEELPGAALVNGLRDDELEPALAGLDDDVREGLEQMLQPAVGTDGPSDEAGGEEASDPDLLRAVLAALRDFDASTFDPVTVFHVHLSRDTVRGKAAAVARVEGIGPLVSSELRAWLSTWVGPWLAQWLGFDPDLVDRAMTGFPVRVSPVVDPEGIAPVDRHEVPRPMREAIAVTNPWEVFPLGTLPTRRCDFDHPVPWRDPKDGGPPGQTAVDGLAPLGRRHHRLKTNGGWYLFSPGPGVWWWRTPTGFWFRVDADGTHEHGRDPELDGRWLPRRTGAPAA